MLELGIVGARNSGKTTVLEKLVRHLTDAGIRVATVKHTSHSHRFDKPGKDSHRHREAGAELTVVVSQAEVAVFAKPEVLECAGIQSLTDKQFDIWLIEGDRRAERPKVLVTRKLDELSEPYPNNIIATIGPARVDHVATHFELNDIDGLSSFVTNNVLGRGQEARP